jgi:hypothetical protein
VGALRAHFLHVGKTGGTAVRWALASFVDSGTYELRLHDHFVWLRDVPVGERCFFVIRDPIDRFVSGFYSRRRQGRPKFDVPWSPAEAEAFATFDTPNALASALTASDVALRTLALNSMRAIGHVGMSYWQWFGDPAYFASRGSDVLAILWQPTLEFGFLGLCERLGLGRDVRLPTDDVAAHRNPHDVDRKLSNDARTNLRRWYSAEFEFVRMCRQHPAFISGEIQETCA